MNKKNKKNTTSATINGADPRLAELLNQFKVDNYELRERSRGGKSLYVRLTYVQPVVQLKVA